MTHEHHTDDHPSAAKSGHAKDALMRSHGFRIFSRVKGRPAVWIRNGEKITEPRLLELLREEARKRGLS